MLRSTLASILQKASLWLKPHLGVRLLSVGRALAAKSVRAALLMGNRQAFAWLADVNYITLLGTNSQDLRFTGKRELA